MMRSLAGRKKTASWIEWRVMVDDRDSVGRLVLQPLHHFLEKLPPPLPSQDPEQRVAGLLGPLVALALLFHAQ